MTTLEENYYCPITNGPMIDPVIGTDGHTYERSAIEEWLKQNQTSPITRQTMRLTELIPNIVLRNVIHKFLLENPKMKNHKKQKLNQKFQKNILIESAYLPESKLYVKLITNEKPVRQPCIIIFIIDVSISMDTNACIINASGESNGYTRLDFVKYTIRTMIEILESQDQICIITFSDVAKLKVDFTYMHEQGKNYAIGVLESLHTEGMTNIWDGLREGLLYISKLKDPNINISMMLLTDGEPNTNPERGICPTLETHLFNMKLSQSFTINTFGYGYSLDSSLLESIAKIGSGINGYIPDSSMVGTVFINYLSNLLCTYLSNCKLQILSNGKIIREHNIGSIQFEQPKEIIIDNFDNNSSNLEFRLMVGDENIKTIQMNPEDFKPHMYPSIIRYKIMGKINNSINNKITNIDEIYKNLDSFYNEIRTDLDMVIIDDVDKNQILNYLQDWKSTETNKGGQISSAFSCLNQFNKWGTHFLRSLMNAYINQQCNNFKDPGVQHFGGSLFQSIKQNADNIFSLLPAPKPSLHSRTTSQLSNMSSYYNQSGSCYDGDGLVLMDNKTFIAVKNLKIGDLVQAFDANKNIIHDKIKFILKTKVVKTIDICNINNFKITPWHPIIYPDQWVFPINISPVINVELDWIYNIVLEKGIAIFINNIPVITLGHGLTQNKVVDHPYYGTNKIVDDLEKMCGHSSGIIIFDKPVIKRTNGLVSKLSNN
jgi:Mg-chelatase subunit ChlD